jgi:hypothetical protein
MKFTNVKTLKESIYIPVLWKDATSNPEYFFDKNGTMVSFKKYEQAAAFLKKERPLLCRMGLKKFPKVGYIKSVSKTDYNILE